MQLPQPILPGTRHLRFSLLFLVLAPLPVFAQETAGSPPAPAEVLTSLTPTDTGGRINAFDVFMACRHPQVIIPADSTRTLSEFCRRTAPVRGEWLADSAVASWVRSVPSRSQVRAIAQDAIAIEERGLTQLLQTRDLVEGIDLSGGKLRFALASATPLDTSLMKLPGLVGNLRAQLDSGSAVDVVVRGYPDASPGPPGLARMRAKAVSSQLLADSTIRARRIVESVWSENDRARLPPDSLWGRVTVHLRYRVSAPHALAGLGEIRFPAYGSELDPADYRILARVAEQIARARPSAGQPIVITGYADSTGDRSANEQLARERAEEIRRTLVEFLEGRGIAPEQIVARGQVLTGALNNYSSERREAVRSAAIHLGDGLSSALPGSSVLTRLPSGGGGGVDLSVEGLASAAANALLERAERQVQTSAFELAGSQLCRGYADLFPQTCLLVRDSITDRIVYAPSFANLQQVVRKDFHTLPTSLVSRALASRYRAELATLSVLDRLSGAPGPEPLVPADQLRDVESRMEDWTAEKMDSAFDALSRRHHDRAWSERIRRLQQAGGVAVVGLYGLEFVRRVADGDDPLVVATEFPRWVETRVQQRPELSYLAASPPVLRVRQFSEFLQHTDSAVAALRRGGARAVVPDTLYLYALRATLLNADDSQRQRLASLAAYVIQGRRQFDHLQVQLDTFRVELQKLHGAGDDGLDTRRQLYARGVGAASSAVFALLFNSPLTRETRDSIAAIAVPVRNLFYAVEVGDMRSAFTETMTLLPRVLPPMATLRTCSGTQVQGCGRMGLSPGALRVAGFAADVSQASSNEEVQDAIDRFLDQSGGAEQKQVGPPRLGTFVNAYVGASGDCASLEACKKGDRSYAAHLPIGLELALRTGSATPGHTFSLFFRAVELSGFLPREDQTGDRSTEEVVASLFRPGAFLLYAPPRSGILRHLPLSVGVGGAAAALRTKDGDSSRWDWNRKFTVFVGWDIPLFP